MRMFGFQFLGQGITFIYLSLMLPGTLGFNPAFWPQISIYNFFVANFWPIYWVGFVIDRAKCKAIYWHVFTVAHARAGDVIGLAHHMH